MRSVHADLDTLQRVREVLAEAMADGSDAAESLDRAGLLWYSARELEMCAEVFGRAAQVLDEMNIRQLAQSVQERMPTSSLDTKRQVVAWLRKLATR